MKLQKLSRIQILGILAINSSEDKVEIIKKVNDEFKAQEMFREFVENNSRLEEFIKKNNLYEKERTITNLYKRNKSNSNSYIKETSNIDWVVTNFDILRKAAIFYIDLLIRKVSGEHVALVQSLYEYLNEIINEIEFSNEGPQEIRMSMVQGLLHPRGSFMRIGLDLRYAITWKDKPTLQAIKELKELKKSLL